MAAPETLAQARTWERVNAKYVADGLCHPCAAQAAWGHQLGWNYRSSRPWPEADRGIKPPCAQCAPVVAGFPVEIPGSPWRRWPQGDRRPSRGAVQAADGGSSLPAPADKGAGSATVKLPLGAAEIERADMGNPELPFPCPSPLPDLIRYMDRFYSADQLRNDLDPMLTACVTAGDRAEVRKYARLRLAGMPYPQAA